MLASTRAPIDSSRRLAPMIATRSGKRMVRMLRASARCSRESCTSLDRSVGRMSKDTSMTPSSKWCETS